MTGKNLLIGTSQGIIDDSNLLRLIEVDEDGNPTGVSAAFSDVEFFPLQYTDLVDKNLTDKVTIPLNFGNARIVESIGVPSLKIDNYATAGMTLESSYTSKAIALVKGGWLPSGLASREGMIVLPDRCTVNEIKTRFVNGTKRNLEDNDFLDFLLRPGLHINPLLFAIEGNERTNPTPELIEQQLREVAEIIKSALPNAEILGTDSPDSAIGIAQDTLATMEKKENFLMRLAPKLRMPTRFCTHKGIPLTGEA